MTAEQWDDEWWRYWEAAKPLPPRGFRLDELLAEIASVDDPLPIEMDNSTALFVPIEVRVPYATGGFIDRAPVLHSGPDQVELFRPRPEFEPRRGWLRRALDRVFG